MAGLTASSYGHEPIRLLRRNGPVRIVGKFSKRVCKAPVTPTSSFISAATRSLGISSNVCPPTILRHAAMNASASAVVGRYSWKSHRVMGVWGPCPGTMRSSSKYSTWPGGLTETDKRMKMSKRAGSAARPVSKPELRNQRDKCWRAWGPNAIKSAGSEPLIQKRHSTGTSALLWGPLRPCINGRGSSSSE